VSSDDSSRQTTVIIKNNSAYDKVLIGKIKSFLLLTSSILECSYPLFSAKLSAEKSSQFIMINLEEFNSEWTVVNTVVTPKIKWAFSSQVIQTTSSMSERQNIDHGLLNDLVENGCRRSTVSICEFGCMMNHYNLIGLYTLREDFFFKLFDKVFKLKSNMGSFYFLSHHLIGTSLGFQCTKWYNLTKFQEAAKSEHVSLRTSFGIMQIDGSIDFSLTLPIGFGKNYKDFLEKIGISKADLIHEVTDREHVLFGQSSCIEDEMLKVKLKSVSQGASKAFSFSSASKQHSTAAYINTRPCLNGRSGNEIEKFSLPAALKLIEDNHTCSFIPSEMTFPLIPLYKNLLSSSEKYMSVKTSGRRRKLLMKLRVVNLSRVSHTSLLSVVQKKWFSMDIGLPKFLMDISYEKYREEHGWLCDTFADSKKLFERQFGEIDSIMFSQYIINLSTRDKTLKFHHQGGMKSSLDGQILDCLGMNLRVGYVYRRKNSSVITTLPSDIGQELEDKESKMSALGNAPPTDYRDELMFQNLDLLRENSRGMDYEMSNIPRNLVPLYVICKLKDKVDRELTAQERLETFDLLSKAGEGVISYYKQAQVKNERTGGYSGHGVVVGIINGEKFLIKMLNDVMTEIFCENPTSMYNGRASFERLLKKLRVKPKSTNYHDKNSVVISKEGTVNRDGVGMIVQRRSGIVLDGLESMRLKISINRQNGFSLSFQSEEVIGDTITFYPRNLRQSNFDEIDNDMIRCWIKDEPFPLSSVSDLIPEGRLRSWSVYTLRLRLESFGMLPREVPRILMEREEEIIADDHFSYDFNVTAEEILGIFKEGFGEEFTEQTFSQIQTEQLDLNLFAEDFADDLNLFDDEFVFVQPYTSDVARRAETGGKRFWDEVINTIRSLIDLSNRTMNMVNMNDDFRSFFRDVGYQEQVLTEYVNPFM
jgi:hypothetical protein